MFCDRTTRRRFLSSSLALADSSHPRFCLFFRLVQQNSLFYSKIQRFWSISSIQLYFIYLFIFSLCSVIYPIPAIPFTFFWATVSVCDKQSFKIFYLTFEFLTDISVSPTKSLLTLFTIIVSEWISFSFAIADLQIQTARATRQKSMN